MQSKLYAQDNFNDDANWKVPAIKALRAIFGMGLKESKAYIESAVDGVVYLSEKVTNDKAVFKNQMIELKACGFVLEIEGDTGQIIDLLKKASVMSVDNDNFELAQEILALARKASEL